MRNYRFAAAISFILQFDIVFFIYSILIASTGQTSTQTPQSTQESIFTTALPSTILIASLGHSGTQASQPIHFCSSTLAGINVILSKITVNFRQTPKYYKAVVILQYKFLRIKLRFADTSGQRVYSSRR